VPSSFANGFSRALCAALTLAVTIPALPAAAEVMLAHGGPTEARAQFGSPAVTLLVSRSAETAVSFTTRPSASCLIGAGATAPMPLTADSAGTVRFHARTSPGAAPAIPLTAACNDGRVQWSVPLIVRSVVGIVHNLIPPPVADPTFRLPAGFDPATASDAEVARLGFPHRPDRIADPDYYRAWTRVVETGVRVAPGAAPRDEYSESPLSQGRVGDVGAGQKNTPNWSGILANGKTGQYDNVVGTWHVPTVTAPQIFLPALSVMWVGIDGADKSQGLYQDGTAQYVYYASGVILTEYFGWYEFVPGYPITAFKNLVVNPGDQVYADSDDCSTGGKTVLCYYLIDYTLNESVSASLNAKGAVTNGCAEWIMERPKLKTGYPALPKYSTFVATGMDVYDGFLGAWTKYGNESHDKLWMYNGSHLLSEAGGTSSGDKAVYTWVNFL
jgi:hypothetical protein